MKKLLLSLLLITITINAARMDEPDCECQQGRETLRTWFITETTSLGRRSIDYLNDIIKTDTCNVLSIDKFTGKNSSRGTWEVFTWNETLQSSCGECTLEDIPFLPIAENEVSASIGAEGTCSDTAEATSRKEDALIDCTRLYRCVFTQIPDNNNTDNNNTDNGSSSGGSTSGGSTSGGSSSGGSTSGGSTSGGSTSGGSTSGGSTSGGSTSGGSTSGGSTSGGSTSGGSTSGGSTSGGSTSGGSTSGGSTSGGSTSGGSTSGGSTSGGSTSGGSTSGGSTSGGSTSGGSTSGGSTGSTGTRCPPGQKNCNGDCILNSVSCDNTSDCDYNLLSPNENFDANCNKYCVSGFHRDSVTLLCVADIDNDCEHPDTYLTYPFKFLGTSSSCDTAISFYNGGAKYPMPNCDTSEVACYHSKEDTLPIDNNNTDNNFDTKNIEDKLDLIKNSIDNFSNTNHSDLNTIDSSISNGFNTNHNDLTNMNNSLGDKLDLINDSLQNIPQAQATDMTKTEDLLTEIKDTLQTDTTTDEKGINSNFSEASQFVDNMLASYSDTFNSISAVINNTPTVNFSSTGSCSLSIAIYGQNPDFKKGFDLFVNYLRPIVLLIMNLISTYLLVIMAIRAYADITMRVQWLLGGTS